MGRQINKFFFNVKDREKNSGEAATRARARLHFFHRLGGLFNTRVDDKLCSSLTRFVGIVGPR